MQDQNWLGFRVERRGAGSAPPDVTLTWWSGGRRVAPPPDVTLTWWSGGRQVAPPPDVKLRHNRGVGLSVKSRIIHIWFQKGIQRIKQ